MTTARHSRSRVVTLSAVAMTSLPNRYVPGTRPVGILLLPTLVLTTYRCRYYFFSELESRLYAHASTEADSRCGASVVRDEVIEVEVEEGGKTEWRRALVGRILPGGRGRFTATVFHPDGTLDDDFVEIFSAAQVILHATF